MNDEVWLALREKFKLSYDELDGLKCMENMGYVKIRPIFSCTYLVIDSIYGGKPYYAHVECTDKQQQHCVWRRLYMLRKRYTDVRKHDGYRVIRTKDGKSLSKNLWTRLAAALKCALYGSIEELASHFYFAAGRFNIISPDGSQHEYTCKHAAEFDEFVDMFWEIFALMNKTL